MADLLLQLAHHLGIPTTTEPWNLRYGPPFGWDGEHLYVSAPPEDVAHELAHWLCASSERRSDLCFGLDEWAPEEGDASALGIVFDLLVRGEEAARQHAEEHDWWGAGYASDPDALANARAVVALLPPDHPGREAVRWLEARSQRVRADGSY